MAGVASKESDRIREPKPRALIVCEWVCRICFTIVFIVNIHCAISFIVDPGPYAWNFGLRGDSGHFAVRGLGIAFLMWNATYPVFIALPNLFKVVGGIVLAQQLIGLIGESLLLPYLPHASFLFAASIMRFIYFDAFGLLIMTVSFVLLCVFSYRANHPRAQVHPQ